MDSEEKALSLYSDFREKLVRKRTSRPKALQKCYNSGVPLAAVIQKMRKQQVGTSCVSTAKRLYRLAFRYCH